MRTLSKFISLLTLNIIPLIIFGAEAPLHIYYQVDPQTMIPRKIEMTSPTVSVPAIIGDIIQSPIIKVMINDQGPFLFALDTGFSETIISKQLADQLNLPIIKKNQVTYVTPHETINEFENILLIHKIQIGNMKVFDYGAIGSGSSAQDEIKFKSRRIDGLISINMFQGVLLILDYKNEMFHIQKGQLSPADKDVFRYRRGYSVPVIEAQLQSDKLKETPYYFILDTGEPNYIYINACTLPVNDLFQNQEKFMQYDLFGKASETFMAQLNGNIKLSESIFIKLPHVTFSQKNCDHSPPIGRFGRKFFEMHEVTFDNKNDLVKIK